MKDKDKIKYINEIKYSIHSLANRYSKVNSILTHEDLYMYGVKAAWDALDKFNKFRNVKFITFATPYIKKSMTRALNDSFDVRQPYTLNERLATVVSKYKDTKEKISIENVREVINGISDKSAQAIVDFYNKDISIISNGDINDDVMYNAYKKESDITSKVDYVYSYLENIFEGDEYKMYITLVFRLKETYYLYNQKQLTKLNNIRRKIIKSTVNPNNWETIKNKYTLSTMPEPEDISIKSVAKDLRVTPNFVKSIDIVSKRIMKRNSSIFKDLF